MKSVKEIKKFDVMTKSPIMGKRALLDPTTPFFKVEGPRKLDDPIESETFSSLALEELKIPDEFTPSIKPLLPIRVFHESPINSKKLKLKERKATIQSCGSKEEIKTFMPGIGEDRNMPLSPGSEGCSRHTLERSPHIKPGINQKSGFNNISSAKQVLPVKKAQSPYEDDSAYPQKISYKKIVAPIFNQKEGKYTNTIGDIVSSNCETKTQSTGDMSGKVLLRKETLNK